MKTDRSRKKRIHLLIFAAVLLFLLGAIRYTLFIKPSLEEEPYVYKEAAVEYGKLQVGIMESGFVETTEKTRKYELDLVEDSEGDTESDDDDVDISEILKVQEVYVAVGEKVRAGDPVYKLKESTVLNVKKKLELTAAECETALSETNIAASLEELEADHTKTDEELKGNAAAGIYEIELAKLQNETAKYTAGIRESYRKIESLQEKIAEYQKDDNHDGITNYNEIKNKAETAGKEYEKADKNNERVFASAQSAYLSQKAEYETMLETIKDCETQIKEEEETIQDYLEKIQNANTNAAVNELAAKQSYDTDSLKADIAEAAYGYAMDTAREDIENAVSDVTQANEKLEDFKSFVGDDGVIYATQAGMITKVNYEEGDSLTSNSDLFSYVTEDSIVLSVDVSQEDISDIAVGDSVHVVFTAYPEETYQGKVTELTTTAASSNTTTVSYPVTVKVVGNTEKLYSGMTGDVTFTTEEKEDILYVSRKAIVEQNGKSYVYRKNEKGEMVLWEISTGFTDGVSVEVTGGLSKGDIVYIKTKSAEEG